jgi:phage shock protein A
VTREELVAQHERLTKDLMEVASQWVQFRVRRDFIGMGRTSAVMDEQCAELRRIERRIAREEKRASAA